jgi:hypothetical protein
MTEHTAENDVPDERVERVRRNMKPGAQIPNIWIVELLEAYDDLTYRLAKADSDPQEGSYYCECGHPWGYHHAERGCTMPLSQHGLPVSSLEVTVRVCGCRVIPPGEGRKESTDD